MTANPRSTHARAFAAQIAGVAREELVANNGHLNPFILIDRGGTRAVEEFRAEGVDGAKARAEKLAAEARAGDRWGVTYVYSQSDTGGAIAIEIQYGGEKKPELFIQLYRTSGRLYRRFELLGPLANPPDPAAWGAV